MSLVVEVKQGKLEGKENTSVLTGKKYYSFFGIPYAKPPVGDLRFRAPEPYEKWEGVYDATHEGNFCVQNDKMFPKAFLGSEDCLFVNIHTPVVPTDIKIPKAVLVVFHGGGFFSGSGSEEVYSADYLITQDVIMVTFNYRLHVLGFLNLGIPDCPGNAGLKDQALALKWVKENIINFGGDPNNITIFGRSAGASSVHFQIMSPLSKGLFSKAIMQSGSALSPWAMTFDPKEMAEEIAQRLGFQGGSAQLLLEFLKKQSADDLTLAAMDMYEELKDRYPGRCTSIPFSPSVETIKNGAFLPELPQKLLESTSPLPIIYGACDKEGAMLFLTLTRNFMKLAEQDFSIILKNNFKIDPAVLPELSAKVKQYYFGDKEVGVETADQLIDLYTDIYYYQLYDAIDFVIESNDPAYLYEFRYNGNSSTFKKMIMKVMEDNEIKINGATHGDDLRYVFCPKMMPQAPPIVGDDLAVTTNMIKLWANFAKTGVPSDLDTWTPSTFSRPCYLQIEPTLTLVDGKVYGERLQFLRDLLKPVAKPYDIF